MREDTGSVDAGPPTHFSFHLMLFYVVEYKHLLWCFVRHWLVGVRHLRLGCVWIRYWPGVLLSLGYRWMTFATYSTVIFKNSTGLDIKMLFSFSIFVTLVYIVIWFCKALERYLFSELLHWIIICLVAFLFKKFALISTFASAKIFTSWLLSGVGLHALRAGLNVLCSYSRCSGPFTLHI